MLYMLCLRSAERFLNTAFFALNIIAFVLIIWYNFNTKLLEV